MSSVINEDKAKNINENGNKELVADVNLEYNPILTTADTSTMMPLKKKHLNFRQEVFKLLQRGLKSLAICGVVTQSS